MATAQAQAQAPPQKSPLDTFFARYKYFTPTPTTTPPPEDFSLPGEFARLTAHQRWPVNSRAHVRARKLYRAALIDEFNHLFGIDGHDLQSWQRLCVVVGVVKVPESVTQCRKLVRRTHVNLVDLVETRYAGGRHIQSFGSLRALGEYTRRTGKYFPREAKSGGVLGGLLRDLGDGGV